MKISAEEFHRDPAKYVRMSTQECIEVIGPDGERRMVLSAPALEPPDSWYDSAGDWLRAIERVRDQHLSLEGLDGEEYDRMDDRRTDFNDITRRYVSRLVSTGFSREKLAERADFPCPGCPGDYKKGPHKFGCPYRGAQQAVLSMTRK